ncbi:hypothetical protein TNCV_3883921 [Trichonephila clavipes]|nr:hypothetical protein TNCV_3883921 [Trichonephila clavipes]
MAGWCQWRGLLSHLLSHFCIVILVFFEKNLSKFARSFLRMRYLDCVSSLQPSIWFYDVHDVATLVGRYGCDFRSEDPMGVKETSAMEVRFLIGGWK